MQVAQRGETLTSSSSFHIPRPTPQIDNYLDFLPFSRLINVVDISLTNTKDRFSFPRNSSKYTTPPHTEKSPPVTVRAFRLLPKRPSCPTDASPSSRSVISDCKLSTPVKVVFFRVPLPRIAHSVATPPSASLSRSLPLLDRALQQPPQRKR